MRYPFGIHCGSWVSHAACWRVHVIGITSGTSALPTRGNRLTPFLRRKRDVLSVGTDAAWLRPDRAGGVLHGVRISADELVRAEPGGCREHHLSIDEMFMEDVVRPAGSGRLRLRHTEAGIAAACAGRVIGADVCRGDVSDYEYASPFKRFLSRLDGRSPAIQKLCAAGRKGRGL